MWRPVRAGRGSAATARPLQRMAVRSDCPRVWGRRHRPRGGSYPRFSSGRYALRSGCREAAKAWEVRCSLCDIQENPGKCFYDFGVVTLSTGCPTSNIKEGRDVPIYKPSMDCSKSRNERYARVAGIGIWRHVSPFDLESGFNPEWDLQKAISYHNGEASDCGFLMKRDPFLAAKFF